ncbi:hypothetical protein KCP78_09885 [Salmonella enterica subsp. enterica]|nr:hypothetical protein KCP78_09885 [Salmonella enterica subsp. enterica]
MAVAGRLATGLRHVGVKWVSNRHTRLCRCGFLATALNIWLLYRHPKTFFSGAGHRRVDGRIQADRGISFRGHARLASCGIL